jgi:glycosyltransferase involved in cell wall biosynthesis
MSNPAQAALSSVERLRLRAGTRLHGVLVNDPTLSELVGVAHLARAALQPPASGNRPARLAAAARRLHTPVLRSRLGRVMQPHLTADGASAWLQHGIRWEHYTQARKDPRTLTTSLVLKAPSGREKGVLYCSFETNAVRLLTHPEARRLWEEYYVVLATSWSPGDYALLAAPAAVSRDPLFACVSNLDDMDAYRVCEPASVPVPIMACDWVEPSYFAPKPRAERTIDVLMVANWLRFKRHWILFDALRHMRRDLRVVLVGHKNEERNVNHVRAEARAWGVPQDVEFVTSVGIDEVTRLMGDARIATLFSRREGSCVAVVECFFADTPVAMMADAHVGARAHINAQTGRLLAPRDVAGQLSRMLEEADAFRAREWALAHLTAERTSAKLNAILRAHALRTGAPWTSDIAGMCWRYVPTYLHAADAARFAPEEARLQAEYGLTIKKYPRSVPADVHPVGSPVHVGE